MSNQKGIASVALLILIGLVGAFLYFNKESTKSPSPKTNNKGTSRVNSNGTRNEYENEEAAFSLAYPSTLKLYEKSVKKIDQESEPSKGYSSGFWLAGGASQTLDSPKYGEVELCVKKAGYIESGCGTGISIFYGIPVIEGKGGYCESEYQNIKVGGQDANICYWNTGFMASYPRHPQGISELTILAEYGDGFSEETAKEILESIKFSSK